MTNQNWSRMQLTSPKASWWTIHDNPCHGRTFFYTVTLCDLHVLLYNFVYLTRTWLMPVGIEVRTYALLFQGNMLLFWRAPAGIVQGSQDWALNPKPCITTGAYVNYTCDPDCSIISGRGGYFNYSNSQKVSLQFTLNYDNFVDAKLDGQV